VLRRRDALLRARVPTKVNDHYSEIKSLPAWMPSRVPKLSSALPWIGLEPSGRGPLRDRLNHKGLKRPGRRRRRRPETLRRRKGLADRRVHRGSPVPTAIAAGVVEFAADAEEEEVPRAGPAGQEAPRVADRLRPAMAATRALHFRRNPAMITVNGRSTRKNAS